MSEVTEQTPEIVLEYVLVDACAVPEDAMTLYRERITPDFMLDREKYGKRVLSWVHSFIDEHGVAPTAEVLTTEFPEVNFDATEVPVEYIITKLRERKAQHELQRVVSEVAADVQKGRNLEAVERGFHEFTRIKNLTAVQGSMVEVGRDWEADYARYNQAILDGRLEGLTWGWEKVDQDIGGFAYGLAIGTGRPGKGKSWQEVKMAIENARKDVPTVLFTLEMSVEEMFERVQCMIANVSYWKKTRGALNSEERNRFREELTRWKDEGHRLYILQPPVAERTVPGLYECASRYEPGLILVDQFKYITPHRGGEAGKRWERSEYICEDLKIYSERCPIFVAAQINREGGKDESGGEAEHVAVSDAILQHADILFRLHQNKEMADNHMVELAVLKARRATLQAWYLKLELYDACDFRFMNQKDD